MNTLQKTFIKMIRPVTMILLLFGLTANAHAALWGLKQGLDFGRGVATGAGLRGEADAKLVILTVINFILGLVGILAVLFLIIAGVMYITSLGNESRAEKAKKMILYVVAGLIVIILSAVIVNLILTNL